MRGKRGSSLGVHIVDATRGVEVTEAWADDTAFFEDILGGRYLKKIWDNQPEYVEVWSERDTVKGVLESVLDDLRTPFRCMHGFNGATDTHNAATASHRYKKGIIAVYIGDFDPSGLYMSQVDLPGRLMRYHGNVLIKRIALTADDVANGGDLTFPASTKTEDPRFAWFGANHGHTCMELDAMDPNDLRERVRQAINFHIDSDSGRSCWRKEEDELDRIADWKKQILGEDES